MNSNQKGVGWGFWLAWVLVSIIGFFMGAFLGMAVAYGLFGWDGFDAKIGITFGIAMGAAGGFLQWFVLREKAAQAGWWVLANALGFAVALGTLGAVGIYENFAMAGILFAAVFGITGGVLQWLVLRRAGIARAALWIPASIIGSLVAAIAFPAAIAINANSYNLGDLAFGVLFGAGLGAIPGAALVWLLRHPKSGPRAEAARQGAPQSRSAI